MSRFSVLVLDLAHSMDPAKEHVVGGFFTRESAREYARRRTRDSLEEMRSPGLSAEALRQRWHLFGETCLVVGDTYRGTDDLEFFVANPATAEERDWAALTPAQNQT